MRKIFTLSLIIFMPFLLIAQENGKIQELGLTTNNLSSVGLSYRIGNNNALWRFNTSANNLSIMIEDNEATSWRGHLNISASIGREWRKPIGNMFELRSGVDLGFGYANDQLAYYFDTRSLEGKNYTLISSINGVFGFNFILGKAIVLGFEVQPIVSYSFGLGDQSTVSLGSSEFTINEKERSFNFDLSTSSALFSLAYRFSRSKD